MRQLGPRCACGSAAPVPTRARLQAQFADDPRIEWLGRLTDADKMARLRGADVFCAPSLHGESFGVVLIEAMAAETAIVASGLDGYRNVATDDVDALLVDPGDVGALADALQRALVRARSRRAVEQGRVAPGRGLLDDRAGPDATPSTTSGWRRTAHGGRARRRRESFWTGWRRRMMAD